MRKPLIAVILGLALVSCSVEYGQTRSSFQGKVANKTLEEAIGSAGKPAREESNAAGDKILVYERKTFDQENANAKDAAVRVSFKKDATGKFVYSNIEFVPESN